ncbi:protein STICHEL-like 2 [Rutidosis leptorrhynchoides]|uniref:protein STICHEL-like 2 n=1 Tax=Rutidosis leptorrhynchoides TaxID=125765 RepID=UPI003A9A3A0D
MDGRRHSVDLPISKTLIALRRVRSLRDPDTNSLSRLPNFADNLNWEINSTNGIVLENVNNHLHGIDISDPNDLGLIRRSVDHAPFWEMHHGQNTHKPKLGLCRKTDRSGLLAPHETVDCENKSLSKRYCNNYNDLPCTMPTSDYLEGAGSCNEQMELFLAAERQDFHRDEYKRRSRCKKNYRSSKVVGGDIMSCVSSPCLSISGPSFEGSSCGTPLYGETTPFSESPRCLSQKFRPKSFDELVGQNVVSKSLLSVISSQKITSFYLFHGPRGTGKTSAARVFAAALNCLSFEGEKQKPCGECQECALFFAGRSRDVKEVDSVSMNQSENLRYLIKNAMLPPVSSSYKVFIIDECQLMHGSTWSTLMNCLEEVSRHIVFIMITPDLSTLPRTAVSRSLKFQFQNINEADIVCKLRKICSDEGFNYDLDALNFVATRSNGSLRDAEMTLEQLSLLGKRITMSLTNEFIGIVSDEELFELLAMALSSDTSNTVKRARELMRSRIDPMQLISQLANLIMDILSGKVLEGASEVKRQFFEKHTSEADLQLLNNALKILSETEKQLRVSKNQTTWLTVALLQLSSAPSFNANDPNFCVRSEQPRGMKSLIISADESVKHLVPSQCGHNNGCESELLKDKVALELIWTRAMELCKSVSLSNFLRRHGNLASVCFHQGSAVVELEFQHQNSVLKAEKSWKPIASALQAALGCNVEIRIKRSDCHHAKNHPKVKKFPFCLFRRARRTKMSNQNDTSVSENVNNPARTIRNTDGNALSIDFTGQEPGKTSCCFLRSAKLHKKIRSLETFTTSETDHNLGLPVSGTATTRTCLCVDDTHVRCCFCKEIACCNAVDRQKKDSKVHCWKSPLKKVWQHRVRQQGAA